MASRFCSGVRCFFFFAQRSGTEFVWSFPKEKKTRAACPLFPTARVVDLDLEDVFLRLEEVLVADVGSRLFALDRGGA